VRSSQKHRRTLLVSRLVVRLPEQDVLPNRQTLQPTFLCAVRYAADSRDVHPRAGSGRDVVHLAEQGKKKRGLARTRRPGDHVEFGTSKYDGIIDHQTERDATACLRAVVD
jgi:hypothetical protein